MNKFLNFNKPQRQGVLWFSLFLILAFWAPPYINQMIRPDSPELTWISYAFNEQDLNPKKVSQSTVLVQKDTLFSFDPNSVDLEQMRLLGFPNRTARTIANYRDKGGRFYKRSDLLKIYGMDTVLYIRLEPYIKLARSHKRSYRKKEYFKSVKTPRVIAVNQASADEWQQLRGIGPVLSKRIVKFRDRLGGFYTVDQVGQTYGLPDSTFQEIKPQLICKGEVTPLAINDLDAKQLSAHPYLGRKEAHILASYRQMHGDYKNFDMLKKVHGVPEGYFDRLKPYLRFAEP